MVPHWSLAFGSAIFLQAAEANEACHDNRRNGNSRGNHHFVQEGMVTLTPNTNDELQMSFLSRSRVVCGSLILVLVLTAPGSCSGYQRYTIDTTANDYVKSHLDCPKYLRRYLGFLPSWNRSIWHEEIVVGFTRIATTDFTNDLAKMNQSFSLHSPDTDTNSISNSIEHQLSKAS